MNPHFITAFCTPLQNSKCAGFALPSPEIGILEKTEKNESNLGIRARPCREAHTIHWHLFFVLFFLRYFDLLMPRQNQESAPEQYPRYTKCLKVWHTFPRPPTPTNTPLIPLISIHSRSPIPFNIRAYYNSWRSTSKYKKSNHKWNSITTSQAYLCEAQTILEGNMRSSNRCRHLLVGTFYHLQKDRSIILHEGLPEWGGHVNDNRIANGLHQPCAHCCCERPSTGSSHLRLWLSDRSGPAMPNKHDYRSEIAQSRSFLSVLLP